MGIMYDGNIAKLTDVVSIEETEELWQWLQANQYGLLDLSACSHLHAANVQLLIAAGRTIVLWPENSDLCAWLQPALISQ